MQDTPLTAMAEAFDSAEEANADLRLRLARDDQGAPEVFLSLQGEGPMAGQRRAFIRFSGCNLHCRWCDTAYTWNWEGSPHAHEDGVKFRPSAEMAQLSLSEARALVNAQDAPGVVITGGEPMMQPRALRALVEGLRADQPARRIEIETNGSYAPEPALAAMVDLFMVSPKLGHSGNEPALATQALATFAALEQAAFKFVARTAADVAEVAALMAKAEIARDRVWIMPEGRVAAALDAALTEIGPAAQECGFNLTDRLHIRLFGGRRGR